MELQREKIRRNIRKYSIFLLGMLVIASLLPAMFCGLFNYATADDFVKSYRVHDLMLSGGNVLSVIGQGITEAADMWKIWEGTWASNFVLAMQPSIFGEHAYAVTVPLCILYTALGTGYCLWEILVHRFCMSGKSFWMIFWMQLFLFLQFMPYIRGGMFWYPGMAHYVMPMCFLLLMAAWMLKWERMGKKRYFVFLVLDAVYLGGSHYQHIILALLILLSGWLWSILIRKKDQRRMSLLWIPIAEILAGLVVCILSPGNQTRGGENFGIHATEIFLMPIACAKQAILHGTEYLVRAPLLLVYALVMVILGWHCIKKESVSGFRRIPLALVLLYLFLLYASAEAPGIYAAGNTAGISGGYFDIVYQCLILSLTLGGLLLGEWLREKLPDGLEKKKVHLGKAVLVFLFLICLKPSVKNSGAFLCWEFVKSGRLQDFVIQMEERIELLNDPALNDIYVPEMNDEQGPFMHLQLSQDSSNYTNEATALYYHKNTVTAVPREQYYREYGKKQAHDIPEAYRKIYSGE